VKLESGGRAVFSRKYDVEFFAVTAYSLERFSGNTKVRYIIGCMCYLCACMYALYLSLAVNSQENIARKLGEEWYFSLTATDQECRDCGIQQIWTKFRGRIT
jgi:hypothetical protein